MPTQQPTPPIEPSSRRRTWLDHGVGLALFVGSLLTLVSTNDMGFVRDEAFYFRHAETYQDWFVDVEAGGESRTSALRRDQLLTTWRNNAEHPPLDKILFGWSWRLFGRKLRPASGLSIDKAQLQVRISGLGASHGFAKDARVRLLRPQLVGQDPDPDRRVLASGVVTDRTRWGATVTLNTAGAPTLAPGVAPGMQLAAKLKRLQAICQGAGPDAGASDGPVIRRTGCEALEERAAYVLSESEAMRAPGALFAALLVWLMWLTARGFFWSAGGRQPLMGRPFAALAAVGFLLLPRAFYHAHLACFDMTIVTLLFATTVGYHASLRRRRWIGPVAVLWGLSLLAKHNALVLPGALMVHWLWDAAAEGRLQLCAPNGGPLRPTRDALMWLGGALVLALAAATLSKLLALAVLLAGLAKVARVQLPPMPTAWFAMLPVGFVVLIVGWPLLWVDTLDNFLKWMEFHLHHEHYMQVYFGRVLAYPPFPFAMPWLLTALTWPLTLLLPAVAGFAAGVGREAAWLVRRPTHGPQTGADSAAARSFNRLCLMSAVWPVLLIAIPSTPVFGGTKHWFLAYPFLLLLAARTLESAWQATLAQRLPRGQAVVAAWLLVLLVGAPAAKATWDVHPHGTAYYNELIGGVPGAARAGMQRQFWGGATRDGLEQINRRAKKHARVWFHNSAWGAYRMYQREGWLRRDLSYSGDPKDASYGFFHHQRAHDDYELECMSAFNTATPIQQVHIEGVPILSVYKRR